MATDIAFNEEIILVDFFLVEGLPTLRVERKLKLLDWWLFIECYEIK